MSASQVTVIVLIAAAFALGWWGHGWRLGPRSTRAVEADDPSAAPPGPSPGTPAAPVPSMPATELDAVLQSLMTAFQAALGVWQARSPQSSSSATLAGHAVGAFERQRAALAALSLDPGASPGTQAALDRARRAADRLSEGLAPLAAGESLALERERALIGAERALGAARYALLAASEPAR
jgi:hypothetical protein